MGKFQVPTNHENPPDNAVIFEEYFGIKYADFDRKDGDRIYLPCYWTNYYVSKNYGNDDMSELQAELDALPRDKSYFTICQWDDGILQDLKDLDIFVYGQGGWGDYPIPLNCIPHGPHRSDIVTTTGGVFDSEYEQSILASFVGSIDGRHPVREKMRDVFADEKDCVVEDRRGKGSFRRFTKVMSQSKFALCPRGYGRTSFRICEALEVGVVPVYIYDDYPWVPFPDKIPFEAYGILWGADNLEELPEYLKQVAESDLYEQLKSNGKPVYDRFYDFEGCRQQILKMEREHNANL